MRKFFVILISLIVIIIGAAIIVPFLIPLDTYKKEAETRLSQMTGREIRIAGDIRLKIFPNIAIALHEVHVGNPEGYKTPYLAEIGTLDVEVALQPLLDHKVEVQHLVLEKPVVNLETNDQGVPNWLIHFNAPKMPTANLSLISNANAETPGGAAGFSINNINLSGFSIKDGTVAYIDKTATQRVNALNISADAVAVNQPLDLDGSFKWNDLDFKVAAKAESLKKLMDQKPSGVSVKLESKHVNAAFNGTASPDGAKGKTEFSSPSLVDLMKWLGKPMAWNKTPLSAAANGNLTCSKTMCALDTANITLDDMKFAGNVSTAFAEKMSVKAKLATKTLDLTRYMDAPKQAFHMSLIADAYAAPSWSTEIIDLSALNALNADVQLDADAFIAPPWQLTNASVHALVQNGAATVNILQAKLLSGSVKGTMKISASNSSANMTANNINIESLLKILNNDDRLRGNADVTVNLTAAGLNIANIIKTLNGTGVVKITNGAIRGVNLAQMARNVKSAFTASKETEQTDFSELGGTFTIKNGVVSNNDLSMKSPYIRLSGAGDINLPAYTINYRLVPKLVDTGKGQGGVDNKAGIEVPIIVSGALDNPKFAPDLESIVTDALKNPEKIKENVAAVKDMIKENKGEVKQQLKDIKGVVKDPKALLKDPAQLNNLGGLLGGFGKAPAEPAPAPVAEPVAPVEKPAEVAQPNVVAP